MKHIIKMLTVITLIINGILFAQPQGQKPQHPPIPNSAQINQMINDLTSSVALSEEQAMKILDLYTEHFSDLKTRMESKKSQNEQHRKDMDEFRKSFEEQVKTILTSDQIEQFEVFLQNHKPPRGPNSKVRK